MKKYIILFSVVFCIFNANFAYSQEIEGFKSYRVAKGDTLWRIAPKEHHYIIRRVNRIDEKHLVIGKIILIPGDLIKALKFCPVPKNIIERKKLARILCIFLDIQYFAAYEKGALVFWGPISSGDKLHRTPKGRYGVLWKTRRYFSKKYANAPMPYAINYSSAGYFIHQQSLPGWPDSHGCVRLLMLDAKKIFYWIKIGDPIEIKNLNSQ